MNNPIDIETIIARRKAQWMKGAKRDITLQERLAVTVPWWLIIIFVGAFALSAGHTAGLFNELSSVGYVAPFVVEFSLLWVAFARTSSKQDSGHISVALRLLEVLAFILAIGANIIGATTRVTAMSGIDSFSFDKITHQYGSLPIAIQAEILFVPIFGLFIPIIAWVTGEGLANLFLKQRKTGGLLEEKWRDVEREELRRAFYSEMITRGYSAIDARRQAETLSAGLVKGSMKSLPSGDVQVLIEPPKVSAASIQPNIQPRQVERSTRNSKPQQLGPTARVVQYLNEHPEAAETISQNQLAKQLGVSVGTVNAVFKARQNEKDGE